MNCYQILLIINAVRAISANCFGVDHLPSLTFFWSFVTDQVEDKDLKVYFYNSEELQDGMLIPINDMLLLENTTFNSNYRTVFIFHDWASSYTGIENTAIRSSIFQNYPVTNLFSVDWSVLAATFLECGSFRYVNNIALKFADFIQHLADNYELNISESLILIGYGVGAHIAGTTGHHLNGSVHVIFGIEPTRDYFFMGIDQNTRIDPTDAKYVQIIETGSTILRTTPEYGHAIYMPNNGAMQPGCTINHFEKCSKERAIAYFAETLVSEYTYTAKRCNSWVHYIHDQCDGESFMGDLFPDLQARGVYYLRTNSEPPYCII